MNGKPDLIGSAEAALIIGRSQRWVLRLVAGEKLKPAMTVPGGFKGTYLFDRADIERIAAKNKRPEFVAP